MALFQKAVLNKYKKLQEQEVILKAYKKFSKYFHNTTIQENIKSSKEEEYQGIFLTELFVNVLGYELSPKPNYNLVAEYKNQNNSRKADGAILDRRGLSPLAKEEPLALGVIELKGTKTKDLESITRQAFDYKANQKGCVYIITSNFEKLRFYINDATDFEEFNLFTLTQEQFELLYICLNKTNIFSNLPLKIKEESLNEEEQITKKFYKDYSDFKRELYRDLVKLNGKQLKTLRQNELNTGVTDEQAQKELLQLEKNVKLSLFKKSQKLIDRFLFIFFAEDRGLLPPNSTKQILDNWNKLKELDAVVPLYDRFKLYFNYLDTGRAGTDKKAEIFAYNGGLFKPDNILDGILISDELLFKHTLKLANYDFESQVDVNILGHIFENSLNEIESVNAEIEGGDFDKQKSKRKKDGVFYTPKYITKYIVENTVGKLCEEKKNELGFKEEEYYKSRKGRQQATLEKLINILDEYREWLLQLTICDPACGSGAFLNQALDFLIKEHTYIDELKTKLLGGGLILSDIENTILENNIFGVDLNEESVEIAKLSLWLRTAQPRRKLNDLSSNIKCGNSLIDSKAVAGDKAFNWNEQFPQVFNLPPKKLYLVTFVTYNSRVSDRMVVFNPPGFIKDLNAFYFQDEDYTKMIELIGEGLVKYNIPTVAFTVIPDHVHLLVAANNEKELNEQIRKLKGYTSFEFQRYKQWDKGENHVWAQKFNRVEVPKTLEDVGKVTNYITNNVEKHKDKWGSILTKDSTKTLANGLKLLDDEGGDSLVKRLKPLAGENKPTDESTNDSVNGLKPIVVENVPLTLTQLNKQICTSHQVATLNKGGFDVVIGNPPYVDIKGLDSIIVKELFKKYRTSENRINLYSIFIEKGFDLLKPKGFLSFINPNSILVNSSYTKIRKLLIDHMTSIIKLPDGVFKDAIVETIIFEFRKNTTKTDINTIVYPNGENITSIENERIKLVNREIWKRTENCNYNIYVSPEQIQILSKMKRNSIPLGEIADFSLGITPYDKYQGHSQEIIKSREFHSIIKVNDNYKPLISGGNIKRFSVSNDAKEYINYGDWLGAKREEKFFLEPRVLVRQIVSGNPPRIYAGYTEEPLYFTQIGFGIIPNTISPKTLLALINSKLINFYHKYSFLDSEKELFQKILIANCKALPIHNEAIKSSDKMELLVSSVKNAIEKQEKQINSFSEYIKTTTSISLSKKLQNWYGLEFGEFIKELNKAIKKENKERAKQSIALVEVLTKKDEFEWMELFEENKAKANDLKAQIDKTDKEIDKMVYALYELTPEEIKIVEES
jgi:type I restriction-modification system DNA methylase subunit/REP element-mobilizing transposase RayT